MQGCWRVLLLSLCLWPLGLPAAAPLPLPGVKRSAAFGTSSTPWRSTAAMLAVAVMPGA